MCRRDRPKPQSSDSPALQQTFALEALERDLNRTRGPLHTADQLAGVQLQGRGGREEGQNTTAGRPAAKIIGKLHVSDANTCVSAGNTASVPHHSAPVLAERVGQASEIEDVAALGKQPVRGPV